MNLPQLPQSPPQSSPPSLPEADAATPAQSLSLPISETFYSIQGEGRLSGIPSFFIRTSGCNLRCTWCDTPYASWNPEGSPTTVDRLVESALASGATHVVITGGEPMMFDTLPDLCDALRAAGLHITIETAGTVYRPTACGLMSISPKLANSTPAEGDPRDPGGQWRKRHEERRLNPRTLQSLINGFREHQLKFVVASPADLDEIDALLAQLKGWRPQDILLMPEGVIVKPREQTDWIVSACLQRNWRFCPRLHIQLFGNTRGT